MEMTEKDCSTRAKKQNKWGSPHLFCALTHRGGLQGPRPMGIYSCQAAGAVCLSAPAPAQLTELLPQQLPDCHSLESGTSQSTIPQQLVGSSRPAVRTPGAGWTAGTAVLSAPRAPTSWPVPCDGLHRAALGSAPRAGRAG